MNPSEKLNLVSTGEIRVRIAPSPTGLLHLGVTRTALFNYLFAKQNNGSFILRIEDTDKERSFSENEKDITESFLWLGINWDEGPKNGGYVGDFGPYRQSERTIYRQYIEKLLKEKKAYRCFCSQEEVEAERQYQMARGEAPKYGGKCLKLSSEDAEKKATGLKNVIRLRSVGGKIKFKDIVRGEIEFDAETIGDTVIAKDEETPLYNLAAVIDDYEMKISHVIRGEDHISNTPKQIMIAEALGIPIPIYAHLPMILAPDRSKLSKRHGAVSVVEYKNQGYLPEAIINFLALLGWNPGTEREIFSMNSLIKEFSLEKINKSGAVFNIKKLDFINGFYIRQKNIDDLTLLCVPYLIQAGLIDPGFKTEQYPPAYGAKVIEQIYKRKGSQREIGIDYIKKVVLLHQERMKKLSEISEFADFFFKEEIEYEKDLLPWKNASFQETAESLDRIYKILSEVENWDENSIGQKITTEAEEEGDKGRVFWPLRVALTGKKASIGPVEAAETLGREKTLKRIARAIEKIKN